LPRSSRLACARLPAGCCINYAVPPAISRRSRPACA
jgi:hypothetical protein